MSASAIHATDRASLIDALSSVLDRQALQRLADLDPEGRSGLLPRVLKTFDDSLRKQVSSLTQARAAGDGETVRHVAHTLKSSSASLGAMALSEVCADLERQLRAGTPLASLDDALQRMLDECTRVAAVIAPRVTA